MVGPFLELQMYVAVLAEEGSFLRAARKLHISQSSLTRKIAHLEQALGVKIFERSTRRLVLTAAGRIALPEMQLSLRHAERAWALARHWGRIEDGPFRLGYCPLIHSNLLPKLHRMDLTDFDARQANSAQIPTPGLTYTAANTPRLIELVLRGEIDAGIGVGPIEDQGLWVESLVRESFCVCIPRNNPLARRPAIPARDFDGQSLFWIPREIHPTLYDSTIEYIQSTGADPVLQPAYPATQVIDIVSHGFGLALLPGAAARLTHMGVVFRPVSDRFLQIETVVFAKRELVQGKLQAFAPFLLSRLRS